MILDATTRKLQILADAAATTTESPLVAHYLDLSAGSGQGLSNNGITSGTTAQDIVAAPASGITRKIVALSIYNADTVNRTYTVRYNDNATTRIIAKVLLNPGQTLAYTTGAGWQVVTETQQGANKASFHAHKNGTNQTGVVPSTETKITATTELYDIGSYYDAPNSKWTPPAGKILIGGHVDFNANVVDGNYLFVIIYKNGAVYKYGLNVTGNSLENGAHATFEDDANGTDYYELYAYSSGAGNKTVSGGSASTYFWGSSI